MKTNVLPNVKRLYPDADIIGVREYFLPKETKLWSDKLNHGWNKFENSADQSMVNAIRFLQNLGATDVKLIISKPSGEIVEPDYKMCEIYC